MTALVIVAALYLVMRAVRSLREANATIRAARRLVAGPDQGQQQ